METTKICKTCLLPKDPLNDFYSYSKNGKTYYESSCKDCRHTKNKKNYLDNHQERLLQGKEYREANADKEKTRSQKYHEDHKEERKQYYQDNREDILENKREYYENNKEAIKEYNKELARERRPQISALQKKRRVENPEVRLRHNVSVVIRQALKKDKKFSILKFLPYSFEELKAHLEKQFEPWMTWNNYGVYDIGVWDDNDQATWTWQLDHIIPQSDLPYTSMEDNNFKKCWALENLRPYSAKLNIVEGAQGIRHSVIKRKRYVE